MIQYAPYSALLRAAYGTEPVTLTPADARALLDLYEAAEAAADAVALLEHLVQHRAAPPANADRQSTPRTLPRPPRATATPEWQRALDRHATPA